MNTLTDLRSTLDRHAEDATFAPDTARTVAVHHRVVGLRRRRRATVAAGLGLALVVAAGAVVAGVGRTPVQPAAPVVLGQRAPATMTSLGYTYRATGVTTTIVGHGSVSVKADPRPRLVSWTTDGPARVSFRTPDGEPLTSRRSSFHDFVYLGPGVSGKLAVSTDHGRVGLVDYALTSKPPAGYTKDGLTFRALVADVPLLGADITEAGATHATTTYVAPQGQVGLHLFCSGLPHGDAVHVSFNGHVQVISSCEEALGFDPGAGSSSSFRFGRSGTHVHVRAWVTSGDHSRTELPAGSVPALRIGVGVYGPLHTRSVGGNGVPTTVEHEGHTWELARVLTNHGKPVHVAHVPRQSVAEMSWATGSGRTRVRFAATGMPDAGGSFSGGQASIGDLWVPRNADVTATLVAGHGSMGVAFYLQID